jgi:hypothetical protein
MAQYFVIENLKKYFRLVFHLENNYGKQTLN